MFGRRSPHARCKAPHLYLLRTNTLTELRSAGNACKAFRDFRSADSCGFAGKEAFAASSASAPATTSTVEAVAGLRRITSRVLSQESNVFPSAGSSEATARIGGRPPHGSIACAYFCIPFSSSSFVLLVGVSVFDDLSPLSLLSSCSTVWALLWYAVLRNLKIFKKQQGDDRRCDARHWPGCC